MPRGNKEKWDVARRGTLFANAQKSFREVGMVGGWVPVLPLRMTYSSARFPISRCPVLALFSPLHTSRVSRLPILRGYPFRLTSFACYDRVKVEMFLRNEGMEGRCLFPCSVNAPTPRPSTLSPPSPRSQCGGREGSLPRDPRPPARLTDIFAKWPRCLAPMVSNEEEPSKEMSSAFNRYRWPSVLLRCTEPVQWLFKMNLESHFLPRKFGGGER